MSKNIVIQEGGLGRQFTAEKLKTNLVGGSSCLWVPEDETQLGIKSITENGTYKASDDGYYGYSEVNVNIPNVGTATGTDGDGDEAVAHTDPTTGELVTDKVPSSIKVIDPPTNPYGIYTDGQSIISDGMLVKAYLASGGEYGKVPNSEIVLAPTTASYDASTDHTDYTIDDTSILADPTAYNLPLATGFTLGWDQELIVAVITADAGVLLWINEQAYSFSKTPATQTMVQTIMETGKSYTYTTTTKYGGTTRISNTPFYYASAWSYSRDAVSVTGQNNVVNFRGGASAFNAYMRDIATILFDGTPTGRAGSHQTITVSWPRPLDGKVLEATFEILVAPGYTPNDGE